MKANLLISYAYILRFWSKYRTWTPVMENHNILIDSGAHTIGRGGQALCLDAYMEACRTFSGRAFGYIMLDVIGNADETMRNLDTMVSAGLTPWPVLTVDMPATRMPDLAAVNPRVCVAGGVTEKVPSLAHRYRRAQEAAPEAVLHGLGFTKGTSVPATDVATVDSRSFTEGMAFGMVPWFDEGRPVGFSRKSLKWLRNHPEDEWPRDLRRLLRESNLHTDAILRKKQRGIYTPLSILSCAAHLKFADYCARHGVRVFFAVASPAVLGPLMVAMKHMTTRGVDWRGASQDTDRVRRMLLNDPVGVSLYLSEAAENMSPVANSRKA